MANFSKVLGLASTAMVFAGMAFGQGTCSPSGSPASALETPLVRVEGTAELVGEYMISCTGVPASSAVNILDILSLPVTSKVLATSGTAYTEAIAIVAPGGASVQGVVNGSQVTFSNLALPTGASTITIANIRVNASSLTVGSGAPPAITESAFVSGTGVNSSVTTSAAVGYAFTGLSTQTSYKTIGTAGTKGANSFLVCQAYSKSSSALGLQGAIDVGENFVTAFKGVGPGAPTGTVGGTANNQALGSEFANNTETGLQPGTAFTAWPNTAGASNTASAPTLIQVVYNNVPSGVTVYVPISIAADQTNATATPPVLGGTLTLVASPSSLTAVVASTSTSAVSGTAALTAASGSATAYYEFIPSVQSNTLTETFSIPDYLVSSSNTVTASSTSMTAVVSFAPVGSTQIPNFVVGPSSTTTTLSAFNTCTTSLLFPFVTNQLGFDTGIAIANTSSDPFGSKGATAQAGTCTLNYYGTGAPSPANTTTANIPSGTVYTGVLSGLAAGFQGYIIAACQFQYAHAFAFITDGVGPNGGLSQGYLAGVIPDVNQLSRSTANPIGAGATAGQAETLGN